MSAISPYKIMNYQPKIQDDFNSFFKKNRATLCDPMRSIKKRTPTNRVSVFAIIVILFFDRSPRRKGSCYLSIALTSAATVVPL